MRKRLSYVYPTRPFVGSQGANLVLGRPELGAKFRRCTYLESRGWDSRATPFEESSLGDSRKVTRQL